ncbi:MAG: Hypothetical protein BHV28_02970 [Candidatus Tokpelaia hoelldobleri]|uniref:M23ase beta-sheet core domain-containing protein n=1 Tax=Candidatus Tokpelaia hoelldobleri TaxID=1902579 RepID=A0A1U9JT28_9HYPH|nr:MAG: Hypothetical protein BHV28_02970 [Candidatus Tokpelaia hoelldoblerii]
MKHKGSMIKTGSEPAIIVQNMRPPDRRQVSTCWLAGTVLTGVTSCTLMGIALFAALDGREQLATPPQLLKQNEIPAQVFAAANSANDRLVMTRPRKAFDDKRKLELSTVQQVDGKEIIRSQTFELVDMTLAEQHEQDFDYPAFNAVSLFADAQKDMPVQSSVSNQNEAGNTQLTLQISDFPAAIAFDNSDTLQMEEIMQAVLSASGHLQEGEAQIATLHYIEPLQAGIYHPSFRFSDTLDVKIVQENVSILTGYRKSDATKSYSEDIIAFPRGESILSALQRANYSSDDAKQVARTFNSLGKITALEAGSVLRLGIEANRFNEEYIVRASIYKDRKHIFSIALNDHNAYNKSAEPEMSQFLKVALEGTTPVIRVDNNNLPTAYDAIFQSALAYNMAQSTTRQLIRVLAQDIDMKAHISANDSLQVFYPAAKENDKDARRDIYYISARFAGKERRYYRFQSEDGMVDYYNPDGRSAKPFLLRKPVPNGVFRSSFGARRHPILGYVRMHSGVDWAAPRGTPIIAAGDGKVIKAGWSSGYGNHTEIRHANGYVSSYSHQSGFARGITEGATVQQGQVIGYVGSTGLSTGPHCHFEVIVNGTKVDPMRIRLPDSKALKGKDLEAFKQERDRIDMLINNDSTGTRVASAITINNG